MAVRTAVLVVLTLYHCTSVADDPDRFFCAYE
jgi:hypothetical protein